MKVRQARKIVRNPSAYNRHDVVKAYRQLKQATDACGLTRKTWDDIFFDKGVTEYEPMVGAHIMSASTTAAKLANFYGLLVFQFNGITVPVWEGDTPTMVYTLWDRKREQEYLEYQASPEYAQQQSERAEEVAHNTEQVRELLAELPTLNLQDLATAMDWLERFTPPSNDIASQGLYNHADLVQIFVDAGYKPNEYVIDENDPAAAQKRQEFNKPFVMGRWIVGQALQCLTVGMPPHENLMLRFIEDWKGMNKVAA